MAWAWACGRLGKNEALKRGGSVAGVKMEGEEIHGAKNLVEARSGGGKIENSISARGRRGETRGGEGYEGPLATRIA